MGSQQPLRLAILETDTPQPNTNAKFGGYAGVFKELLRKAAASLPTPVSLSSIVSVSSYHVVEQPDNYPRLEDVDALLLTGSKHTAADDVDWINKLVDYTRAAVESGRVKVIGVCFGHQILGRAMGAQLGLNEKGWELAVTDIDLSPEGVQLFKMPKMRIQQMHRDIVLDYPPGAVPIGSNSICLNQGMYKPGEYISVQGHPEFTGEIVTEILNIRQKQGILDEHLFEDAIKRADIEHDGVAIGRTFLEFLTQG